MEGLNCNTEVPDINEVSNINIVLTEESLNAIQAQIENFTIELTDNFDNNSCESSIVETDNSFHEINHEDIVETFKKRYEKTFTETEEISIDKVSQEPESALKTKPTNNESKNDRNFLTIVDGKIIDLDEINSSRGMNSSVDDHIEHRAVLDEGTPKKRKNNDLSEELKHNKKRMKPFEPPKLKEANRDIFCWKCHKFGENILPCSLCPRVFHMKCSNLPDKTRDNWICDECTYVSRIDKYSNEIDSELLLFVINRVRQHEFSHFFENPVNLEEYPDYKDYVVHSICLSELEMNIKNYHSCEEFIADFKWIVHNSYIYNSASSKLTTSIRSMLRMAVNDCKEISLCSECYKHANLLDKNTWFIEPCSNPHILLWAKFHGSPYWPGKMMAASDNGIDVRFFGDHNKAIIPPQACYLYSSKMPVKVKISPPLGEAIVEAQRHIRKIMSKYSTFCYAPLRTLLNPNDLLSQRKLIFPKLYGIENPNDSLSTRDDISMNLSDMEDPFEYPLVDPEKDPLALDCDYGTSNEKPQSYLADKSLKCQKAVDTVNMNTPLVCNVVKKTGNFQVIKNKLSINDLVTALGHGSNSKSINNPKILIAPHSVEKYDKNNLHSIPVAGVTHGKSHSSCSMNGMNIVKSNAILDPCFSGKVPISRPQYVEANNRKLSASNEDAFEASKNIKKSSISMRVTAGNSSNSGFYKPQQLIKQVANSSVLPVDDSDMAFKPPKRSIHSFYSRKLADHDNIFGEKLESVQRACEELEKKDIKKQNLPEICTKKEKFIPSESVDELFDVIGKRRLKGPLSEKLSKLKELLMNDAGLEIKKRHDNLNKIKYTIEEKIIDSFRLDFVHAKSANWCKVCFNISIYHCCSGVYYCSKKCMDKDWPKHREACSQSEMPLFDRRVLLNGYSSSKFGLNSASPSHARRLFEISDACNPNESSLRRQADIALMEHFCPECVNDSVDDEYYYERLEERLNELVSQSMEHERDDISKSYENMSAFPKTGMKAKMGSSHPEVSHFQNSPSISNHQSCSSQPPKNYDPTSASIMSPVISDSSTLPDGDGVNQKPIISVKPLKYLLKAGRSLSVGSTLVSVGSHVPGRTFSNYTIAGNSKTVVKSTTSNR